VFFLAQGLERVGDGGGDAEEQIVTHEIPLQEVLLWLQQHQTHVDIKLLAGLFAAGPHLR
jgi:hypothetical protein